MCEDTQKMKDIFDNINTSKLIFFNNTQKLLMNIVDQKQIGSESSMPLWDKKRLLFNLVEKIQKTKDRNCINPIEYKNLSVNFLKKSSF